MDIGKLKNNSTFYQGYEDEPEVIFELKGQPEFCVHVWDGYMDDLFSNPRLDADGWIGFTRDYQEGIGAWGADSCAELENLPEYLEDLRACGGRKLQFEESRNVLALLIEFLEWAMRNEKTVVVRVL